jgi:single-strand DNA-binding protein
MRDQNSFNKVILVGNLGQDPEVRVISQSERAVANFTLATNERIFNPSTNQADIRTEWHRIVVWGKLAEFCQNYLNKGKQILLEGRLRTEKWQDRDGNQRTTTKIHAYAITLLGRREDTSAGFDETFENGEGNPPRRAERGGGRFPESRGTGAIPDLETEDDDDVPF